MFESLQPVSYALVTIFFTLSTTTILLRTYTRGFVIRYFGLDDWCMLAVFLFNCGQLAILYFMLSNGAGLHVEVALAKNPQWLTTLVYALFVEEVYYTLMHWVIKMAFLLFYLRIFTTKLYKNLIYCTMVLNTLTALASWLLYCLQCIPLDAYFHPAAHPTTKCLSPTVQAFVPAELNIIIDILIVALPIRPLWTVQVSMRKRITLISIVSLGALVVLISSLRMIVLNEFRKETDVTYTLGKLIIISSIEIDTAIIAANGPSLKTFWCRFISRTLEVSEHCTTSNKEVREWQERRRKAMVTLASCHAMSEIQRIKHGASDSVVKLREDKSAIVVTSSVGVERSSVTSEESEIIHSPGSCTVFAEV